MPTESINKSIIIFILATTVTLTHLRPPAYALTPVIIEANDGVAAVKFITDSLQATILPFDLVMMDNVMVDMHGPEAASIMRAKGYDKKIIGITGNVFEADVKNYLESGASCVLQKPLKINEFTSLIIEVLEAKKLSLATPLNSNSTTKYTSTSSSRFGGMSSLAGSFQNGADESEERGTSNIRLPRHSTRGVDLV